MGTRRIYKPGRITRMSFATYGRTLRQVLAEDPFLLLPHKGAKEDVVRREPTDHSSIMLSASPNEVSKFFRELGFEDDKANPKGVYPYGPFGILRYVEGSEASQTLIGKTYRSPELLLVHEIRNQEKEILIVWNEEASKRGLVLLTAEMVHRPDKDFSYWKEKARGSIITQSGIVIRPTSNIAERRELSEERLQNVETRFRLYRGIYAKIRKARLRETYATQPAIKHGELFYPSTPLELIDASENPYTFMGNRGFWDAAIRLMERIVELQIPAIFIHNFQGGGYYGIIGADISALNRIKLDGVLVK